MNRKWLLLLIIFFIAIIIVFGVWNLNFKNNSITENNSNNLQNSITDSVDLSTTTVTDDCVNEWEDYAKTLQEDIESASNDMANQDTRYLVKDVNGYIYIYYLDDKNDETLYKKTDISTEYLSIPDLDDLEIGIEVIGSEELNKLLEDFE